MIGHRYLKRVQPVHPVWLITPVVAEENVENAHCLLHVRHTVVRLHACCLVVHLKKNVNENTTLPGRTFRIIKKLESRKIVQLASKRKKRTLPVHDFPSIYKYGWKVMNFWSDILSFIRSAKPSPNWHWMKWESWRHESDNCNEERVVNFKIILLLMLSKEFLAHDNIQRSKSRMFREAEGDFPQLQTTIWNMANKYRTCGQLHGTKNNFYCQKSIIVAHTFSKTFLSWNPNIKAVYQNGLSWLIFYTFKK